MIALYQRAEILQDAFAPPGARRDLHKLDIDHAAQRDAEMRVERVGVVAAVEECFWGGWVFEDGAEGGGGPGGGGGGEGEVAEAVDVDDVDL